MGQAGQGTLLAGVVGAAGDIFSGAAEQGAANARKQIARQNARVAEENARHAMAVGDAQETQQGLKNRAVMGATEARQGASGVDVNSGSAQDVRLSQRILGQLDAGTIRSNAAREAYGYRVKATDFRNEAAIAKSQANQAMWAAGINAAGSLLSGGSSAAAQYAQWKQAGAPASDALAGAGETAGSGNFLSAMLAF